MNMSKWEKVAEYRFEGGLDLVHKMKVEGGYLYRTIILTNADNYKHMSTCFVPYTERNYGCQL